VTGGQNGYGGQQHLDGGGWDNASGDPTRDGSRNRWNGNSENGDSEAGNGAGGLAGRLQAAIRLLPPALGGAPTQPLEVGRTTRTVAPAQRNALVVRDGGCAFPGCDRPQGWCEAHHLRHWAHGGPTDLANLALLCWAHHRAVHEGGWQLGRDPDGRLTATPPHRRRPTAA
jgi:HNH endonuclease